jgi:hypothetical protein
MHVFSKFAVRVISSGQVFVSAVASYSGQWCYATLNLKAYFSWVSYARVLLLCVCVNC